MSIAFLRERLAPIAGPPDSILTNSRKAILRPDGGQSYLLLPDEVWLEWIMKTGGGRQTRYYPMTTTIQFLASEFGSYLPPAVERAGDRLPQQAFDAMLAQCDKPVPVYKLDAQGQRIKDANGKEIIERYDSNAGWKPILQRWRQEGKF